MTAISAGHAMGYSIHGKIPCDMCRAVKPTAFYLYAGHAKLRLCVECANDLEKESK